jgi:hypothetical protein
MYDGATVPRFRARVNAVNNAESFLSDTAPAVEGLFGLLNGFGWKKMTAIAQMLQSPSVGNFEKSWADYTSVDVARDAIAGAILQLAYMGLKMHARPMQKAPETSEFEREINALITRSTDEDLRLKSFALPEKFSIGRLVGALPIGTVIWAARHQYNHFDDLRLAPAAEVIFNHLHQLAPRPGNGLSFNFGDKNRLYSYSIVWILGWTDRDGQAYSKYRRDMAAMLDVESRLDA